MGLEAAGAYLRVLRDEMKLSRVQLAEAINSSESQIVRLESGKADSAGTLWMSFTRYVGGVVEEVADLLLNPGLSKDDGEDAARRVIAARKSGDDPMKSRAPVVIEMLTSLPDDELIAVLIQLQTMKLEADTANLGKRPRRLAWRPGRRIRSVGTEGSTG